MKQLLTSLVVLGALLFAGAPGVAKSIDASKAQVVIKLVKGGEIVIKLYPKDAPETVANFVKLIQKGFYDGLTFHRVVPGFVAQGGDPAGNGSGGPGYTIKGEFTGNGVNNTQKHVKGAVAMARTPDPNSAGSQFYICLADLPQLDGQYAVFGQVVKGMEYVEQIQVGDKMEKVSLVMPKKKKAGKVDDGSASPVSASSQAESTSSTAGRSVSPSAQ